MAAELIQNARAYASRHRLQLAERLGFGVHGMIFVAENKSKGGKTAVKAHREDEPYRRECAVYARLRAENVTEVLGFHVPQFIRADDELRTFRTPHYDRARLPVDEPFAGPAVIFQRDTTTLVPPGWQACADQAGNLLLAR